jgi:hypothetical protein
MFYVGVVCVLGFMVVAIAGAWAAWVRAQRFQDMPVVAAKAGLQFSEVDRFNSAAVPFPLFRKGEGRRIKNLMWRDGPGHPRVFDYGYFTVYRDKNGNTHQRWHWFACALVQHNGRWPELLLTRERLVDRVAQTLGIDDVELESEEFNRTFVVQCENRKFATDMLDPQMMEFLLGTQGMIEIHSKGRFVLATAGQLPAAAMVGLLGVAEGFVARVPPTVWDVHGRFPDGMGTEQMPAPPVAPQTVETSFWGDTDQQPAPYEFAPAPRLGRSADAWDPTPEVDYDLDGNPVGDVEQDPWGEGRSAAQ